MTLCQLLAIFTELRPRCWKTGTLCQGFSYIKSAQPKELQRANLKKNPEHILLLPVCSVSFPQETVILMNWIQVSPTRRIDNLKKPGENKTTLAWGIVTQDSDLAFFSPFPSQR